MISHLKASRTSKGSGPTASFSHVSNLEDMKIIVKDKVFKT